jgi:diketogulonate reductase-like aldo/keto reductase
MPRFQGENFKHNLLLVEKVREIAGQKKCTQAQLALAWLLAQGEDIVPIPGTKRRERLEENLRAIDIELTDDDLRRIGEAAPPGFAAGTRYPEAAMNTVNRCSMGRSIGLIDQSSICMKSWISSKKKVDRSI